MVEVKVETSYSNETDMTFIMEFTYRDGDVIKAEVKGFYWGEPEEEYTKFYYGKTVANMEM